MTDLIHHLPTTSSRELEATRHAIEPAPPVTALDNAILVDIAEGLLDARPLWEPALDVAPDRRGHIRLLATEVYEAWLITWPVGHGVELHDHGGSTGVIAVAEGHLVEIQANGGGSFRRAEVAEGHTHVVPADRIHDVVNTGTRAAVSIHVYSPPLKEMTFYDPVGTHPIRTERVYPEEPAVSPRTASRSLHPSSRLMTRGRP